MHPGPSFVGSLEFEGPKWFACTDAERPACRSRAITLCLRSLSSSKTSTPSMNTLLDPGVLTLQRKAE